MSSVNLERFPLAFVGRNNGGLFIDGDWIESKDLSNEGVKYLTTGNVGVGVYKEQGSGYISEETFYKLGCTEVFPGDILISRLNLPVGRACIVPEMNTRMVTAVDNVIVRPSENFDRHFLVYLLCTPEHLESTSNLARGTTMQRISGSALGRIRLSIPNLPTQKRIAEFLDRETARIDQLIAKKTKLNEVLKEKRSAMITAAVTGQMGPCEGLDRGFSKVDGVMSQIRLKYLLSENDGGIWGGDPIGINDTPVLRSTEQNADGSWRLTEAALRNLSDNERTRYQLLEGDIVVTKSSGSDDHIGKSSIVTAEIAELKPVYSNFMQKLRVRKNVYPRFVWHILNSRPTRHHYVVEASSTSGLGNLTAGILSRIPVLRVDFPTQKRIANFLDQETARINLILAKNEKSIEKLKERRAALITAAVTGQIDLAVKS